MPDNNQSKSDEQIKMDKEKAAKDVQDLQLPDFSEVNRTKKELQKKTDELLKKMNEKEKK